MKASDLNYKHLILERLFNINYCAALSQKIRATVIERSKKLKSHQNVTEIKV